MDENRNTEFEITEDSVENTSYVPSKTVETIANSLKVVDLFAGVGGLLDGLREALSIFAERMSALVETIVESSKSIIVRILEHIREFYQNFKYRRKERRHPRPLHALIEARILIICAKHFTVGFLEYFTEIRKTYLLRSQDRSSSDKESNVENMYVTC